MSTSEINKIPKNPLLEDLTGKSDVNESPVLRHGMAYSMSSQGKPLNTRPMGFLYLSHITNEPVEGGSSLEEKNTMPKIRRARGSESMRRRKGRKA